MRPPPPPIRHKRKQHTEKSKWKGVGGKGDHERERAATTLAFLPSTSYHPDRKLPPFLALHADWRRPPVDAPRRIWRVTGIKGGHNITATGMKASLGRRGTWGKPTDRCSRYFDPRQTGVRRRCSPPAAHALRKRSGLGSGWKMGGSAPPAWSIRQEGSIRRPA